MSLQKINFPISKTEWVLESLSLLMLLLMIGIVIVYYPTLPDLIPRHFNMSGHANAWGSKSFLFMMPAIGTAIYLLFTVGVMFPRLFNYPFEITANNADRQFRNMTIMIRVIKIILGFIFFYITYATIQISLGKMESLGPWTAVFILLLFLTVGFFVLRAYTLR